MSQSSNNFYLPFEFTFNGNTGGAIIKQVYIRNNNEDRYYTGLTLQPLDSGSFNHTVNNKWNWKLIVGDVEPTHEDWIHTTAGALISLSDLGSSSSGDTYTYLSVWIRAEVPARRPAQNIKAISLQLNGEENLVS